MVAGLLRLRLRLPAHSLKEKRAIVKPVVERLRHRFNAAVAEADDLDAPGCATLMAAVLAPDAAHADRQLQAIARAVEGWRLDAELLAVETELVSV